MRTLVAVVAHPDDDAYGIAGTVALHASDDGFRFVLVHATDGEGGDIREGFPATRETLGAVRRAEDVAGWRALGRLPDRHVWLGYPDGGVAQVPPVELVDAVWAILEEEQPTVVFTFGPDGVFGHPDHIAIGAATDAAFARGVSRTTGRDGPAFSRLLHGAVPESKFQLWNSHREQWGLPLWVPTETYHMRGVPDEEIGVVVDCREVADRIVAGLREHRSQLHVMSYEPDDVERWARALRREFHVVAWPPRTGEDILADVFDGLS